MSDEEYLEEYVSERIRKDKRIHDNFRIIRNSEVYYIQKYTDSTIYAIKQNINTLLTKLSKEYESIILQSSEVLNITNTLINKSNVITAKLMEDYEYKNELYGEHFLDWVSKLEEKELFENDTMKQLEIENKLKRTSNDLIEEMRYIRGYFTTLDEYLDAMDKFEDDVHIKYDMCNLLEYVEDVWDHYEQINESLIRILLAFNMLEYDNSIKGRVNILTICHNTEDLITEFSEKAKKLNEKYN